MSALTVGARMKLLLPIAAVLIWSGNNIVNKLAAGVIEPSVIAFYRWLLALLVMTPFVLVPALKHRREWLPYWPRLLVLGLLGMVLYQSLAYVAAHTISALLFGIFLALVPVFTILLGLPLLRTPPTLGIVVGAVLSFAGLVWLLSQGHPSALLANGINLGEVLMLLSALSYALYGVLTKRWAMPINHWQSLYVQIFFGVLLLIPNFLLADNMQLSRASVPLILYAGIPASIIAPWLWIKGMHLLEASLVSLCMNLIPVFTAIIAVLFLHESLHLYHYVGGAITIIGVILAQRLKTPLRKPEEIKNMVVSASER